MACFSLSDAEHLVGVGGGIIVSSPFGLTLVVGTTTPHARAIRLLVYSAALRPTYSLHAELRAGAPTTVTLGQQKKKKAGGRVRNAIVYKIALRPVSWGVGVGWGGNPVFLIAPM